MSEPGKRQKKVLFVDDDQTFLETIRNLFGVWSKESWNILLAENTGRALAVLRENAIDLIIIDFTMPVMDGLQFLRLVHKKFPDLPKVLLTSADDPKTRDACLENGAELFLQKPVTIEGLESVYATLNEVVSLHDSEGFRGMLRRVGLPEVIQLECLGTKSSLLEIASQGRQGRIYIRDGAIVHAYLGDITGVDAFNQILSLGGGDFALKPFMEPRERTINDSWEMLLMEAARLRDEGPAPSATPAAAPVEAAPAAAPDPWANVAGLAADAPPAPPSVTGAAMPEAAAAAPGMQEPNIEELLVCGRDGGALYEWQCQEGDLRLELIKSLQATAKELSAHSPLGALDRVEILSPKSRVVLLCRENWTVLTRSSNSPLDLFR